MSSSRLIVFTASFPFGKAESFLENEVPFLMSSFDEVLLLPTYLNSNSAIPRNLPGNVRYERPLLSSNRLVRMFRGIFNLSPVFPHLKDLVVLLRSGKNLSYNFEQWLISFIILRTFLSSRVYADIVRGCQDDNTFYFYWASGLAAAAQYFPDGRKFMRVHGAEINFVRHHGYIPLVHKIFDSKSVILAISEQVRGDLKLLFNKSEAILCRLGVYDNGLNPSCVSLESLRIVSCSSLIPLKRVHLIIEALSVVQDISVEWIHFGGGELESKLKTLAGTKLGRNVSYVFMGHQPNRVVLDYYSRNHINLFVNVSDTEGIPVSIMEALSFGIPCFATRVGGVAEIIDDEVGYLVDVNFSVAELAFVIRNSNDSCNQIKRSNARRRWEELCSAEKNYGNLIEVMTSN